MMGGWNPLLDRGDGVWVGVVDGGLIGVGSRDAVSKTAVGGNYIPLWPLLERDLVEVLSLLAGSWDDFSSSGFDSPECLVQVIVDSAIRSGSSYWIALSLRWLVGMSACEGFSPPDVRNSLIQVVESPHAGQQVRHEARRCIKSLDLPGS